MVVWRLDRLGRSLPHLIETIGELEAREVGFKSVQEPHRHHHPRRPACRPVRSHVRSSCGPGLFPHYLGHLAAA